METKQIWAMVDEEVGRKPEAILTFLEALAESSYATANHLRENWQDENSAKAWDKIGDLLWKANGQVSKKLPF